MSELSFGEAENWVDFVERQIGYKFVNRDLLVQAFVRKSYSMENGGENNEVLEFIGDKALDLSVVKTLTDKYGHMISDEPDYEDEDDEFYCEYSEGKLTHLKSLLVRKEYLSARIDELKLAPFLIMSKTKGTNFFTVNALWVNHYSSMLFLDCCYNIIIQINVFVIWITPLFAGSPRIR